MTYLMYKDNQRLWRWLLKAVNNEIIAVSSESYHNKQDCVYAANLVKSSGFAPIIER